MKAKLKAKIDFEKNIAKKFHDTRYYQSYEYLISNMDFMEKEKERLRTEKRENVTKKIKQIIKDKYNDGKVFMILEKIYKKNQEYAFNITDDKPLNSDLMNLLADVSLLMISYNKIRKNKGAMTEAAEMSEPEYKKLDGEKRSWVNKTAHSPDELDIPTFLLASKLIKANEYPWGTSRRIYVDKPGKKDVKRPITIPPFMDKVVQEALTTILMSIYEPYFESKNCSFGFRPNKGVHDAIISLTNSRSNGLNMALEGDIKSAYDKVNRKRLIEILEMRIQDKKLLSFIEKRLNYEFYDTKERKHIRLKEGLPQGGIDSPYMWNIYMSIFDDFITSDIANVLEKYNYKGTNSLRIVKRPTSEKRKIEREKSTLRKIMVWIDDSINKKVDIKDIENLINKGAVNLKNMKIFSGELHYFKQITKEIGFGELQNLKDIKIKAKNLLKQLDREGVKIPFQDQNKKILRMVYVRYADDWILLTNAPEHILIKIKEKISEYLMKKLDAQLALDKTLITNMKSTSAHFLGYEIKTYANRKIGRYKKKNSKFKTTAITAGSRIFTIPDRQRLIDRLHMKGYCTEDGFPREIGFLSYLEDFSIIERFNSVLRGITLYYTEFIKAPSKNLSRWIYIIRYSCIKTIAQKHKLSVREVFKKYRAIIEKGTKSQENTIEVKVQNTIEGQIYYKKWRLFTTDELLTKAKSLGRREKLFDIFWQLDKKKPVIYGDKDKKRITNDNFYDKLNWVNIRTQASFDLPCAICGTEENIEMHHIKHVRKNKYNLIDSENTWLQAMSIRNRKQIPVCKECHINIIHKGNYGGINLKHIAPKIMYDNRIITIESHISRNALNKKNKDNYTKTLIEKGWVKA